MFSFYLSYIVILFDADMMISSFSLLNFEFLWGPMFFFLILMQYLYRRVLREWVYYALWCLGVRGFFRPMLSADIVFGGVVQVEINSFRIHICIHVSTSD